MFRTTLLAVCLTTTLAVSSSAGVDDMKFKTVAAKKAAEDFKRGLGKLDETYRKGLESARLEYIKALEDARKDAIKTNNLEEAERTIITIKRMDELGPPKDTATSKKMAQIRQRISNTTWEGTRDQSTITFNTDGTVTASWLKGETGYWYVNTDFSVYWWSTGSPWVTVMKFNFESYTYQSFIPNPAQDEKRTGKRLK